MDYALFFSQTQVFTINYALFPNIICDVQKRDVLQLIMLSFSQTSVFTMNYTPCSFSKKNNMFYNELCYLFTKTTVFTMNFTILRPFWHRAGPVAEQSRAEPSRAGPRRAEPSWAGLGRAEPSRAEPSRADPSRAGPSRTEPSRAELWPSRAEPGREGPPNPNFPCPSCVVFCSTVFLELAHIYIYIYAGAHEAQSCLDYRGGKDPSTPNAPVGGISWTPEGATGVCCTNGCTKGL